MYNVYCIFDLYLLFTTYSWWKVSIHSFSYNTNFRSFYIERETFFQFSSFTSSILLKCYGLSDCLLYHIHWLEYSFLILINSFSISVYFLFFFVSIIFFFHIFFFVFLLLLNISFVNQIIHVGRPRTAIHFNCIDNILIILGFCLSASNILKTAFSFAITFN